MSKANEWVKANVIPHLDPKNPHSWLERTRIADSLSIFIGEEPPELWAYCGAFDHVILVQLFKGFDQMPKHYPYFTHDIAQLAHMHGDPELPDTNTCMHHALADARWNKEAYEFLIGRPLSPGKFKRSKAKGKK